jgi:malate dehydrogenase (oxaloacetate-decarboxylating)(NADP+)
MNIPVFHDDQHGTAIVVGAGIINALWLVNKSINQVKVVINGAGAAGIACAQHLVNLGVAKNNIYLCDSMGVIYQGRTENMNTYKEIWVTDINARSLAEVIVGADVFIGLSVKDVLTPEMLLSMNNNPIVFALANPDPEIAYDLAYQTRSDIIMATGRSDYPNQINNLLAFPYIFRAALDVRATKITNKMKLAATYALAELARQPVPEVVKTIYQDQQLEFGKKYIIPKPLDPRLLEVVTVAVVKAAYKDNVAQLEISDLEAYTTKLNQLRSIKL